MTAIDFLRAVLDRTGWTHQQLADALSQLPDGSMAERRVHRVTVSEWLSGRSEPPPYLWRALEHAAVEAELR
jgi:hypothetical protein